MQKTMNPFHIKRLINFYLFQCDGGDGGGDGGDGSSTASADSAAAAGIAAGQSADAAPSQSDSISLSDGQTFGADMGTATSSGPGFAALAAEEAQANMTAQSAPPPSRSQSPAITAAGLLGITNPAAAFATNTIAGMTPVVGQGLALANGLNSLGNSLGGGVPASGIPATVDGAGDESKPGLINSKEDTRDEPKIKPIVIDYYNAPYEQAITQEQQKSIAAANASMYGSGSGWGGTIAKYQKSKLGA